MRVGKFHYRGRVQPGYLDFLETTLNYKKFIMLV